MRGRPPVATRARPRARATADLSGADELTWAAQEGSRPARTSAPRAAMLAPGRTALFGRIACGSPSTASVSSTTQDGVGPRRDRGAGHDPRDGARRRPGCGASPDVHARRDLLRDAQRPQPPLGPVGGERRRSRPSRTFEVGIVVVGANLFLKEKRSRGVVQADLLGGSDPARLPGRWRAHESTGSMSLMDELYRAARRVLEPSRPGCAPSAHRGDQNLGMPARSGSTATEDRGGVIAVPGRAGAPPGPGRARRSDSRRASESRPPRPPGVGCTSRPSGPAGQEGAGKARGPALPQSTPADPRR